MPAHEVRQARPDDHDDVAAFTEDTWSDRDIGDYIPDVFPDWVESNGPDQHTVVATVDDTAVGVCQALLLSADEAWLQGMRVHPDHRGADHGERMVEALFEWVRQQGATVARNLVFGWNGAGMGQSRAVGFRPETACRWLEPAPDPDATPSLSVVDDLDAVWRFWTHCAARDRLSGLARASDQRWALSELDRARLETVAERGRAFALVADGDADTRAVASGAGTRAVAVRAGTVEREEETVAEYAIGAWADADACADLLSTVSADAAECGADAARVLVPDTVEFVSDAAAARCSIPDASCYIFAADLTASRH